MSRTDKDVPYRLGGSRHRYWITSRGHAAFTRQCRRQARAQARNDLRHGHEPAPRYPTEYEYWD